MGFARWLPLLALFPVMLTACSNTSPSAAKSSTSTTTQGPTATQPPTTTTTTVGNDLSGMGATVAHFSKANGVDHGPGAVCSAANSCFGPAVKNDESGQIYLFTNIVIGGGLITSYQQNFVPNTTISKAETEIMQYMPGDATMGPLTIDNNGGSCGLFNIMSPILASLFSAPAIGDSQGVIGVELEYINSSDNITYDPNNIQDAGLSPLPVNPSDSC